MSTEIDDQTGGTVEQPDDGRLDKRVMVIAGVVVLGAVMSILDITVVAVAQRTFQETFDKTQAQVAWTSTAYTLALATVIPMTGWAADRFGTKRLYILALVLFTAGSALCSTATSLEMLVAFRVLQGLGGGMLMPLGMTILTRAAGPARLGRVMAILGVPMLLGPIFGPILGGWLIDVASWHWIFLINVPIGIVAAIYAWRVLDRDQVHPSESFDFVGMLLLSPGLALFLYGVSSIPAAKQEHGTMFTKTVVISCVVGLALVIAFVPWALRKHNIHPLIQLRLFSNRYMTVAVITMSLFAIAFFGAQPAVHALLPAGARRDPARLRLAGRAPGLRGDDHDADRRLPGRPDRPRQGGAGRPGRRHRRHGDARLHRRPDALPLHHDRVRDHGPRHGRHHDAGLHCRAGEPARPRRRPRVHADEHHPAGLGLDRHGAVLGAADQRLQPAPQRQRHAGHPERRQRQHQAGRDPPAAAGSRCTAGRPIYATGLHYMGESFGQVFVRRGGPGRRSASSRRSSCRASPPTSRSTRAR